MNPIVVGIGKKALDLFYKKFGKRIANTVAESKWLANTLRLLKQKAHKPKTSDVVQRVHEKMLKDKSFQGFTPKIVPKKPNPLADALKTGKYTKVPTPKTLIPKTGIDKVLEKIGIKDKIFIDKGTLKGPRKFDFGSKVIYGKFPKKPPGKADGGSVDKALPKRSRDI